MSDTPRTDEAMAKFETPGQRQVRVARLCARYERENADLKQRLAKSCRMRVEIEREKAVLQGRLAEAQKLVEAASRDCNATALERNELRGREKKYKTAVAMAKKEEFFHDGLSGDLLDCEDKATAYLTGWKEALDYVDAAVAEVKESKDE